MGELEKFLEIRMDLHTVICVFKVQTGHPTVWCYKVQKLYELNQS